MQISFFHPRGWVWVHMRNEIFWAQRKSKLYLLGDGNIYISTDFGITWGSFINYGLSGTLRKICNIANNLVVKCLVPFGLPGPPFHPGRNLPVFGSRSPLFSIFSPFFNGSSFILSIYHTFIKCKQKNPCGSICVPDYSGPSVYMIPFLKQYSSSLGILCSRGLSLVGVYHV